MHVHSGLCVQEGVTGSANRSSEVKNELAQLSQNVETLSEELKSVVHKMACSSPSEATQDPTLIEELNTCVHVQQTELAAQSERFKQMEQQIPLCAEAQQVQDILATIDAVSSRLEILESESQGPPSIAHAALQVTVQEVQQQLLSVREDIENAQALSNRTTEIQHKCVEDVAGLFAQINHITARLEQAGDSRCLASSVEALQEQVQVLGTDIESYQQRSENVQNSGSSKLNELFDTVSSLRELVVEHTEKLHTIEASTERTEAAEATQVTGQTEHVDEALQEMAGQLSALSEVIANTKADSAELREIVSAERNASSQMKQDVLEDKLALEDRLEAVEEKLEDLGLNTLQRGHFADASRTLHANQSDMEDCNAMPGSSQWTENVEEVRGQLGARLDDLSARIEDVASGTAVLSGEVGDTTASCSALQESIKLMQNAIVEMQLDPQHQALSLPAAQELSLRVAALDEQLEDMRASYQTRAGAETGDQTQGDAIAELLAVQQATSDALDAFKAAVNDHLSAAVQKSHLTEMRADIESELQAIRTSLLQSGSTDIEVSSAQLQRFAQSFTALIFTDYC